MEHIQAKASFCKLTGHLKEVSSCTFNKRFFVTCSGDKTIRVYSSKGFTEKPCSPVLAHTYAVNCVTFDSTGDLLASASTDCTSKIWKITENDANVIANFQHTDSNTILVCRFSPNSEMLVTGSSDGAIAVWSIGTKKRIFQVIGHPEGNVNAAAFSPCSEFLVTGSGVGDIRIWDGRRGEFFSSCILQTQAHDKGVSGYGVDCICFSPTFHVISENDTGDSYLMATCGQDNQVKLWLFQRSLAALPTMKKDHSSRCLQPLHELCGHNGPVSKCCFSPDGLKLASSSFDKTVIIWSPITAEQIMRLDGHTAIVTCVAFSFDGKHLASTSYDKTTIVWKLPGDDVDGQSSEPVVIPDPVTETMVNLSTNDPPPSSAAEEIQPPFKEINHWTTDDVVKWLADELKLAQYSTSFKENEIDGDELVNLTTESLSQDLGVAPLGHRNKILRGVKNLQSRKPPHPQQPAINPVSAARNGSPVFLPATSSVPAFMQQPITPTVTASPKLLINDNVVPDEYLCPISRELMLDPVLAADGHSYERKEIEGWFKRGNRTSPMTNTKLVSRNLIPNQALKTIINQFLEGQTTA